MGYVRELFLAQGPASSQSLPPAGSPDQIQGKSSETHMHSSSSSRLRRYRRITTHLGAPTDVHAEGFGAGQPSSSSNSLQKLQVRFPISEKRKA
jgi:hypothetical protein